MPINPHYRWQIGDRVLVQPTGRGTWYRGEVIGLDLPDLPRGVKVKFTDPTAPTGDCYATHAELRRDAIDFDTLKGQSDV